jgi:hypothetical protein
LKYNYLNGLEASAMDSSTIGNIAGWNFFVQKLSFSFKVGSAILFT